MEANLPSLEERSCQQFVQKFYDWYWNQFADKADDLNFDLRKLHSVRDVLRRRPAVLNLELDRLLEDEEKQMEATREIGNLDFDPFLNSQDPRGKYLVERVAIASDSCLVTIDQGHEVAELKKSGSSWLFVNFRYSYYSVDGKKRESPDDDLIDILKR